MYHVMNRGDRKEDIFLDDPDRPHFLETLGEARQKTASLCSPSQTGVADSCLLPDAKPLSLSGRNAPGQSVFGPALVFGHGLRPVQAPACACRTETRRHKQCGHLFGGRYKSLIVDGSGDGYLKTVCDYAI